nr:vomeronasal type-1 receptor 4-like [Castor canadensis]
MSPCAWRNDCNHNLSENVVNDKLDSGDLTIGMIFLSQTVIGILGNFSLLYHYLFHYHTESRWRSTDLILKHLLIANSLLIVSLGVPHTIVALGLKHFFTDFDCNLLLYVQRVGRGVSINTTCLLSVFQAITISPTNSCWKDLKVKAPKYIGFSISFCWILHVVVNFIFPLYMLCVSGEESSRNITKKRHTGYCSIGHGKVASSMYTALIVFPEVSFSALIFWASCSMIVLLYRHKKKFQHIHSTKVSSRCPESRATRSILVLVSTFISFYTLSSMLHISIALYNDLSWCLLKISDLISVCFPTISPFLIMSQDSSYSWLCFGYIKNTKLFNLFINT